MMKIYTQKNIFKFSSEMLILAGLLDYLPKEEPHSYNRHGESRYGDIINWCNKNIEYVDKIEDSDICVLPYKFKERGDQNLIPLLKSGKDVWCFYNDDDENHISLPEKIKLFRTSAIKSRMGDNEYILPPLVTDRFDGNILKDTSLSIGFVGHNGSGRKKYIDVLLRSELKTYFILRDGFWAKGVEKNRAVREYFENMDHNLFTFCYRGAGNFSYRFYETLMMGRIPILVTTDNKLPFENEIKYQDHAVIIPEEKLKNPNNIISWIIHFYKRNEGKLEDIQLSNRELWENYFSPVGFLMKLK